MPDLSDIEARMVDTIVAALYPQGTDQESLLGVPCRVYRGWPMPTSLNGDLATGIVNITVAPDIDTGRTTTRFSLDWAVHHASQALYATVHETTVSLSGEPSVDQSVGILVDGLTHIYRVREGDSIAVIAANLAAMIRSGRAVHLMGSTLSIPGAVQLVARVATGGTAFREARRQERDLRVMAWCPGPEARDQAASAIDSAFAATSFLITSGDIHSRITYKGTSVYDQAQNSQLYRRDLVYTVEYPTILSDDLPAMLFGDLGFNMNRVTA